MQRQDPLEQDRVSSSNMRQPLIHLVLESPEFGACKQRVHKECGILRRLEQHLPAELYQIQEVLCEMIVFNLFS